MLQVVVPPVSSTFSTHFFFQFGCLPGSFNRGASSDCWCNRHSIYYSYLHPFLAAPGSLNRGASSDLLSTSLWRAHSCTIRHVPRDFSNPLNPGRSRGRTQRVRSHGRKPQACLPKKKAGLSKKEASGLPRAHAHTHEHTNTGIHAKWAASKIPSLPFPLYLRRLPRPRSTDRWSLGSDGDV